MVIRAAGAWRQFYCRVCGWYFLETHGTVFFGSRAAVPMLLLVLAALGQRVLTRAQSPVGLSRQALLFLVCHNFCLVHASLRLPLDTPQATRGTGSPRRWQERTPVTLAPARKCRCGHWADRPRLAAARGSCSTGCRPRSSHSLWHNRPCPWSVSWPCLSAETSVDRYFHRVKMSPISQVFD
jgi:hypothetical protein